MDLLQLIEDAEVNEVLTGVYDTAAQRSALLAFGFACATHRGRCWVHARRFFFICIVTGPLGMLYVFTRHRRNKPGRLAALLGMATMCFIVGVFYIIIFGG